MLTSTPQPPHDLLHLLRYPKHFSTTTPGQQSQRIMSKNYDKESRWEQDNDSSTSISRSPNFSFWLNGCNVRRQKGDAKINVSTADDGLNLYDYGHHFEHMQLLLILLRSLPYASRAFQVRAIQDLLFLACSNSENRSSMTSMPEWPEWLLEVLISNFEMGLNKDSDGVSIVEIEDLIHNFLIIMLEHSMRRKDGWKDVESTIHCAEWLSIVGGSSTGEQRVRREESLPVFKRRLLGGLLDFSARELQVQSQPILKSRSFHLVAGHSDENGKEKGERGRKEEESGNLGNSQNGVAEVVSSHTSEAVGKMLGFMRKLAMEESSMELATKKEATRSSVEGGSSGVGKEDV
ncbi:hypothetical protein ZIOFF_024631 [Zingiber officinale]|uniref:DUF4704 domain-containing protein n=1 Tax=Zingiber officinale TaxID=94328 RepID=A0A8J5GTV5_ZINOF|nr:hypothetical protein ZIOFF_024631 [Zingiber officinale]